MTDDEVIDAAEAEGVRVRVAVVDGKALIGFTRGDDTRYPAFGEERLAISYMGAWLQRGRVFA
jgi:hypothetical protein